MKTTPSLTHGGRLLKLAQAQELAEEVIAHIAPYCMQIAVAGSVRREAPEVHDIELVAIPIPDTDMFGVPVYEGTALDAYIEASPFPVTKNGPKYKKFYYRAAAIDLFLVTPPAQFGSIFAIRTGPADFSRRLVTPRNAGGFMPSHLRQKDGALWNGDEIVETPTEEDYFKALGFPWILPKYRYGRANLSAEHFRCCCSYDHEDGGALDKNPDCPIHSKPITNSWIDPEKRR